MLSRIGVPLLTLRIVLTWISIYWFSSGGPTASTRLYYEARVQGYFGAGKDGKAMIEQFTVKVPIGISFFPKEPNASPES